MKTVCIVQARMGSTRLPGKVLLPLNAHTVIAEVLTRCKAIPKIDELVCAIPDTKENNKLADEAGKYAKVFRGAEHDVLGRYRAAAVAHSADVVMRITGDCPLLSPELCGEVLAARDYANADYASNIEPRTFPQGFDCEVFTRTLLERAHEDAHDSEREHVTTWMRRAKIHKVNVSSPWKLDGRLTLDTEDDYRVICAAFGHEPHQRLRAA